MGSIVHSGTSNSLQCSHHTRNTSPSTVPMKVTVVHDDEAEGLATLTPAQNGTNQKWKSVRAVMAYYCSLRRIKRDDPFKLIDFLYSYLSLPTYISIQAITITCLPIINQRSSPTGYDFSYSYILHTYSYIRIFSLPLLVESNEYLQVLPFSFLLLLGVRNAVLNTNHNLISVCRYFTWMPQFDLMTFGQMDHHLAMLGQIVTFL